jgi:hypothetical protein
VTTAPASAAGFTVTSNAETPDANLADNICATAANVCTLRAAVQQANASAGTDVITVPAMTISLEAVLPITTSLTIQGAGARQTVLASNGVPHGMLAISAGVVTVGGVTISGATGGAGALAVSQTGGALTLDRIRVTGNLASGVGATYGPVYIQGGTMTLRDSEVSANSTTSTSSSGWGGAVSVYNGTVTVVNSTLAGNTVAGASTAHGGGVWAGKDSLVTITSSTIAGNTVNAPSRFGAGVFQITGGTGSIEVSDSILADPKGVTNCSGGGKAPSFANRNLIDDTSCGAASATRTIAAAQLGDLEDNGGTTNTRVPGAGSPAIDAASVCVTPADQRGQARPIAGACDLGATEVGSDREASVTVSNPSPSAGSDIVVTATARNKGADRSTGTSLTITTAGAAQLLSATAPGGPCTIAGDTATCALGALASGDAVEAFLTVRMPATGAVTASATVAGQQPDPVAGNDLASAVATVLASAPTSTPCSVLRNGTAKRDVLSGTAAGDRINGKGGNDRINGKAGSDCLAGGAGKDKITGGPGADRISAGAGNDVIAAKDGARDRINCGSGTDTVTADRKDRVSRTCEKVRR